MITSLFETGRLERAYYTQSTRECQNERLGETSADDLNVNLVQLTTKVSIHLALPRGLSLIVMGAGSRLTSLELSTLQAPACMICEPNHHRGRFPGSTVDNVCSKVTRWSAPSSSTSRSTRSLSAQTVSCGTAILPTRYIRRATDAEAPADCVRRQIGTYQAACLAKRHGIPFMVVAPVTTLDLSIETGAG